METKDTCLTDQEEEFRGILLRYSSHEISGAEAICRCREQTEISFEAGYEKARSEIGWIWLNDGDDHLESLACTVLIEADHIRQLIEAEVKASPPCAKTAGCPKPNGYEHYAWRNKAR